MGNTSNRSPGYTRQPSEAESRVSESGDAFTLSLEGYQNRKKQRILGGTVKKLGRRFAGIHSRWIVLYTDLTLHSCRNEEEELSPTKIYSLLNSQIAWGRLATNEYALRLKTVRPDNMIPLVFNDIRKMQQWVGGIRCMYAGTDRLLVAKGSLGGDSCTICISDFQDGEHVSVLPCDHRFCPECIDQWFAVSTLCPCCKRDAMVDGSLLIREGKFQCREDSNERPGDFLKKSSKCATDSHTFDSTRKQNDGSKGLVDAGDGGSADRKVSATRLNENTAQAEGSVVIPTDRKVSATRLNENTAQAEGSVVIPTNPFVSNPMHKGGKVPPEEDGGNICVSEENIVQLTSMGFPEVQVVKALQANSNDLRMAMESLMAD